MGVDRDSTRLRTLATYEANAELYRERSHAETPAEYLRWLDAVIASLPPGAEILELGSGPGVDAVYLENRGLRVRRTDGARAFVDMLQAQGHPADQLDVVMGQLPGPVDGVFANAVLHHLSRDELAGVLVKVRAALRPGGLLAFTVKEGDGDCWSLAKLDQPRYFSYWREPALRALLTSTGWTVVAIGQMSSGEDWLQVTCHVGTPDPDGRATTVSLDPVTIEQRPALERLWQLYVHDLSEFRGTLPDENGQFESGRLALYLDDPDRRCHLISDDSRLAGFVLTRTVGAGLFVLGEFFVVRAVRRRGVGRQAALSVLRMHPGEWEIAFQEANPGAARFWRGIAAEVAGDAWSEELRPVPDKPQAPPDNWLTLTVPARPPGGGDG